MWAESSITSSSPEGEEDTGFILVEIVSALNVPNAGWNQDADPYVTVCLDGREIHRTHPLIATQYPIWTLDTQSLLLIDARGHTFKKVHFSLKEYESFRADPTLGDVEIAVAELMAGKGMRSEFPMIVPPSVQELTKTFKTAIVNQTRLVLRFKPATRQDIQFIQTLEIKKAGKFSDEAFLPPIPSPKWQPDGSTSNGPLTRMPPIEERVATFIGVATDSAVVEAQTLLVEAMKPSQEWVNVGSPNAPGKVYVEVLACDDLPNLDSFNLKQGFGNLTDAFCCLVIEDSIVNTSYITDKLNPRWMPTGDHRAFVFGVQHPSSHLYLGVFNHNSTSKFLNPFFDWTHTPIGRVLINLTQFHPDTLYTLHYHLYPVNGESAKARMEGKHNGTLIIRLRIEWERQILDGMSIPPEFYVSVPRKTDFQTATYTTEGEMGTADFRMTTFTGYLEELQTYVNQENLDLILGGLLTVLLWRGTYTVRVFGWTIDLPVHSMLAFSWGVLVTENYNRLPSFAAFAVAWLLLASMEQNRKHPSPWHNCEPYWDLFRSLVAELCSLVPGHPSRVFVIRKKPTIAANENIDQIQPHIDALQKRKEMKADMKRQQALELQDMVKKNLAELAILSEASVATLRRETVHLFSSLNPLVPILHPVQLILQQVCIFLRIVKSIVTWEENYYPFWIVTACLLVSVLLFYIPWGVVLRWTTRIVAWTLLGPWMKIVDWYYFKPVHHMTPEEKERYIHAQARASHEALQRQLLQSRTEREAKVKLKSMMKHFFGKYVVRVPRFQEAQFLDDPLPASTAVPYEGSGGAGGATIGHVCGQTLVGDMVPARMPRIQPFLREMPQITASERNTSVLSLSPQLPLSGSSETTVGKKRKKKWRRLSFGRFLKKLS